MSAVLIDLEPEESVLDGRYLSVVINKWLEDRALRMSNAASVRGYRVKIRFFIEWWEKVGASKNWQLRETDLAVFNQYLTTVIARKSGKPLRYKTRKEVLGRLRSALKWAYEAKYTRHLNCALWVPKSPEGSGSLRIPLGIEVLAKMMMAAARQPFKANYRSDAQEYLRARNQALLALFVGTGARLDEITNLTVEDIVIYAGGCGDIHIRAAKKVRGREIHERISCFDAHAGKYLESWLDIRGEQSGPLWVTAAGRALTNQGIYKAMSRVAKAAAVRFAGCHEFRRTFTTYFAEHRPGEGYYHLMQLQIGHKPQGVTHTLYDLRTIESIREIFCSPMEAIAPMIGEQ